MNWNDPLPHTDDFFEFDALENIVGKGENADNQHFLLFTQCFLPYQGDILPFQPK